MANIRKNALNYAMMVLTQSRTLTCKHTFWMILRYIAHHFLNGRSLNGLKRLKSCNDCTQS